MGEVALFSFVLRFIYATAGLAGIVGTLYLFNKLTGSKFDAAYDGVMASPLAAAIYAGVRVFSVFLYYGLILG